MNDIRPDAEPAPRELVGYVRAHFLMSATELARARKELLEFADSNGYRLTSIYIERIESAPAAFQSMVRQLVKSEKSALVVPSLYHLAGLGNPTVVKEQLEERGTTVLVAQRTV